MVHLEVGQNRLTQPHPLHAFELPPGCDQRWLSSYFQGPCSGSLGSFCTNHILLPPQPRMIVRGGFFSSALPTMNDVGVRLLYALSPVSVGGLGVTSL